MPRDYYEVLGVERERLRAGDQEGVSRASPASCTRTSTATTPRPRRSSRRPPRPTRSSPTPSGGGPTTPTATRACARAAGRRAAPGSARSRTSSAPSSAAARPVRLRAPRPRRRRRRRRRRSRSRSRRSLSGATREVRFDAVAACEHCRGNGAEPGTPIRTCERCDGAGELREMTRTPFGQMVRAVGCDACGGDGKIAETPCGECGGRGRRAAQRTFGVDVPAGIEHGQRVRISGAGHAGDPGAPAGDLYVEVRVAEDDRFERDGQDLVTVVDLPATAAMLGTTIGVRRSTGSREVEVAAGTQPGSVSSLRGLGLPRLGGGHRGDHRVVFNVIVPTNLSEEQRDQARDLDATLTEENLKTDRRRRLLLARAAGVPVDPPRRSLPARAGGAGAGRALGPRAERRRGGARPRLRRVRDLRRRGRASRPRLDRGGGRRRPGRGRLDRDPRRLGRPLAGLPRAAARSATGSGCGPRGASPVRGDRRRRRRPRPGVRHRRPPDDEALPRAAAGGGGARRGRRRCSPTSARVPGVLAIAAARLGWAPVEGCDHEAAAVEAAAANAAANGVEIGLARMQPARSSCRRSPPPSPRT